MTLPLLAVPVLATLLLAWKLEFRHREESLPTLSYRRHVAPVAVILGAALAAILFVLAPLVSLSTWPRSTQVAWTGAEAADDTLTIGGAQHAAITAWPNGNFWPEVRIESRPTGYRLETQGGTALVRIGDAYANGERIASGEPAKQLGKFSVQLKRQGWLFRRKLLIGRTPVAEPLIVITPPPVHATRARALDALLVPRLNDLRRNGKIDLATVHALEQWAGSIRVLRPESGELRLIADNEPPRAVDIDSEAATVEILWPRRRIIAQLTKRDGHPRISFEAPWTHTTSLPPFEKDASTLSFAREPEAGKNTFLLPLGYGAADFRHEEPLQISPAGLPRFRNGADLIPAAETSAPRLQRRESALRSALQPNRALSSIEIPVKNVILTVMMVRDLPTPRAVMLALLVAWLALAVFVGSIAFGRTQRLRLRDLWCIGGVLVAVWTILLFRVLLAIRYVLTPAAIDQVTVGGLASSLAALVIVPGFIALAVRLWLHHRPGLPFDARGSAVTIAVAATLAIGAAIEHVIMPREILPNVAARMTSSPFDRLLLIVYAVAAIAAPSATRSRTLALLWEIPYRATFETGRAFWTAVANGALAPRTNPNAWQRYAAEPVRNVWNALRSPELKRPFEIWAIGAAAILLLSAFAPEYVRQIAAPFWIIGLPAMLLLARPVAGAENALRVLDGDTQAVIEPPLPDTIAAVVLLAFAPVAVMFGVLSDFGAIYAVMAFWVPLALLLYLTSAMRMAATLLVVFVTCVVLAYQALLGTYAIAPGMTEHILSRVEVQKHGVSAQEWLLDLEAPSAADPKAVTASNVRNALVHEWEHMALVRKGGWSGLGFNRAPASQSFIRQDTIQYDSVYSFFVSGEHGLRGGLILLTLFAIPAVFLLLRRTSLRIGDVLAISIAAALLGEAAIHAAMNVAQLWFSGRNLPLLATASNSDLIRWALLLGLMCQALLWSSRLGAGSTDAAPETAVTRRSVFDPAFGYANRRMKRRLVFIAIIAAGLLIAMLTGDIAWFAFAAAIPVAMSLRTREYAALALLPAILVAVLVLRGSIRALRSSDYDVLTWSRLLKRVDELYDAGRLQFDPASKKILFREEDNKLTDRPTGATLLEAEVLRFNAMPERLRLDGGRESLTPGFFARVATPADYYEQMFALWQRQIDAARREKPSVFTINRVETDDEGVTRVAYEVTGNPDFNVVHSFAEELSERELEPVTIRGEDGKPLPMLGPAWAMGRWVYAPTADARQLGLGWMREAGEALVRVAQPQRGRAKQLTIDEALQRATQPAAEAAGRELFNGLLRDRAANVLPPRVAITILRATTGETLAMGAWPRAASGERWRSRTVTDGTRVWTELEPPLAWLGSTAARPIASRHAVDANFAAIEMGSAAKPFWATAALTVHPKLDQQLLVHNGECDKVVKKLCYERALFGVPLRRGWQVSPFERWVDFPTYLAASDNRYHTRLGILGLAKAGERIADDGRGLSRSGRESVNGRREPWNRYPALADGLEHTRDRADHLGNLHQQPIAASMRDLFAIRGATPSAEGELRRHLLSFWSGDERDDLRASTLLEPMAIVSPEAVDLRLRSVRDTREYLTVLLGGGSSRWSNIAAAAAFSSWATRKPVVPHIVQRDAVPLPSRVAAFEDEKARNAAAKLRPGLRRVVEDGTALAMRPHLRAFRDRGYEIYAKTGTLATIDERRPTSRILITILRRGDDGNVVNAITLSLVAERASTGFATAQAGRFIERNQDELLRLLEGQ